MSDFSLENGFDYGSRHVYGSLNDLIDNHRAGDKGKIINALDFPMPGKEMLSSSIATDVVAFLDTVGSAYCPRETSYPHSSMKWGLAATSWAHHLWHMDCNGLGTYIDVHAGWKWWIVATPRAPLVHIADVDIFMNSYLLTSPNSHKFELEAVLLPPGSRL